MLAQARSSVLFTDVSLTDRMSATSADRKPSTSLSIRTARCCGGRRCGVAIRPAPPRRTSPK
jgi:hypothetical protein